MISPLQFAQACADTYVPETKWDHEWRIDGVHIGHRLIDGMDLFAFEGSKTAEDWMRDLEGWPAWHPELGFVHAGFLHGEDDVFKAIRAVLTAPRAAFTGHSLGGAEARVQAALFATQRLPVAEVHVFGSPRPAFENLSRIIQKSGMRHVSWRNRNDPVPLVPGILPMWTHPEPWGVFSEAPAGDDFDPLRDHHMALYLAGAAGVMPAAAGAGSSPIA